MSLQSVIKMYRTTYFALKIALKVPASSIAMFNEELIKNDQTGVFTAV